jgi:hypothetical protein
MDRALNLSLRKFFPRLTCLTSFACRMILSEDEFDKLTAAAGKTLRSLVVHFDYRLPKVLPLFNRLQHLQDLNLVIDQHLPLQSTLDVPCLPALRHLEMTGKVTDIIFITIWLARMPPAKLQVLRIHATTGLLGINMSHEFFRKHCRNLSTLGLHRISGGIIDDVLFLAPRLQYLELSRPDEIMAAAIHLPTSLQEVIFTKRPYHFEVIKNLVKALQQVPMQHCLRIFRYSRVTKFGNPQALLWNEILGPRKCDKWFVEPLRPLRDCLEQLEELNKDFVDESGMSLGKYLASTAEVQPPFES